MPVLLAARPARWVLLSALVACDCGGSRRAPDASLDASLDGSVDAIVGDATSDAEDASEDAGPPPPVDVRGVVRLHGCDPETIEVRLVALDAALRTDEGGSVLREVPAAPVLSEPAAHDADVERTAAGEYTYRARALPTGQAHRLDVRVDDDACGELVWRGPSDGLVFPGLEPRDVDGLALRTELQVRSGTAIRPVWRRADFLTSTAPSRTFRVRTPVEGVRRVELQISTERFDADSLSERGFCEPPRADVPAVTFDVRAGSGLFFEAEVDLASLFTEPGPSAAAEERTRWRRIQAGAPIYVRAVPADAEGRRCDLGLAAASNWVELVYRAPVRVNVDPDARALDVRGTYFAGWYPHAGIVAHDAQCYRVITDHRLPSIGPAGFFADPMGHSMVLRGLYPSEGLARVGDFVCLYPGSGGGGGLLSDFTDALGDLVGSVADAVEWAVNQAAQTYESIKRAAIRYVATAIADLTGCEEVCEQALTLATEMALASMGLPPSLPDFDALVNEGFDYLAAELANEVGVPDWVAEQAVGLAREMVDHAHATRGMPLSPWLVPDTGGRSSVLRLEVRRLSALVEPRTHLWIWPGPPSPLWQRQVVEVDATTDAWTRLPVVLQPDFAGLPELEPLVDIAPWGPFYGSRQRAEAWYQTRWGERIGGVTCAHFEAWGSFVTGLGPIPVQPDAAFDMTNAQDRTLPDPFARECTP